MLLLFDETGKIGIAAKSAPADDSFPPSFYSLWGETWGIAKKNKQIS
jgi:hypothetical protein